MQYRCIASMRTWPPTIVCCGVGQPTAPATGRLGNAAAAAAAGGLVRPWKSLPTLRPVGRGCTAVVPTAEDRPAARAVAAIDPWPEATAAVDKGPGLDTMLG